jgi:hypothetical protein
MKLDAYRDFTRALVEGLASDGRVRGVVALGSMAEQGEQPDAFSDHDFFVVVEPGAREAFRGQLSWLPRPGEVALSFRETEHGLKVVYSDGHLLEFAVFSPEELALARINRYRVLLDRADVAERLERVAKHTQEEARATAPDDAWLFGQLLTGVLVGAGRAARGERLSGRARLAEALRVLCVLVARHRPAPQGAARLLDGLDPLRRVERVYPALGQELGEALEGSTAGLARVLLEATGRELAHVPGFPHQGLAAVRAAVLKM